ncbi:MAG: hypothetical protein WAM89_15560 [Terriglobales bacterium]
MPSYPTSIRRCQHIKVNGTQCGSPALRDEKYCYYHLQCHQKNMQIDMNRIEHSLITLPSLEDANSIQVGLAEVMRMIVTNQIDHRSAQLLLQALRTASTNLKFTSLEPTLPTQVIIDPKSVAARPLGATAWSAASGCAYDQAANLEPQNVDSKPAEKKQAKSQPGKSQPIQSETEGARLEAELARVIAAQALDPAALARTARGLPLPNQRRNPAV